MAAKATGESLTGSVRRDQGFVLDFSVWCFGPANPEL
jgi:hypothetical protein